MTLFNKYKIKVKKLYSIIVISIIEIIIILWSCDWNFSIAALIPLIQFVMIFENRDIWKKLTEKEKEEIIISEDDIEGFISGIDKLLKEGYDINMILKEIKEI